MTQDQFTLEKLPGHRRGLINGASAWLAPDHILLVRSQRFKEEYKRYYLRDIQAIAIASAPNFHISSRAVFVVALWAIALLMSFRFSSMTVWVWTAAIVLAGAWIYISADRSCVCRIYTAVSSDPLPSVYRTWTARKFLATLEPRIRLVQGEVDPGWVEAVEQRPVGPEIVRDSVRATGAPSIVDASPLETAAEEASTAARGGARTLASNLFLAAVLLQAVAEVLAFNNVSAAMTWTITGLAVAQMAAASFVFVDRSRGRLRSPVHRLAIAKLIWMSVLFYSNPIARAAGARAEFALRLVPVNDVVRGIDVVLSIGLVATGLLLTYRPAPERRTSLLGN